MQRRDFLKLTAAVGMASALPLWSRAVFAASRPALPIPSLLAADARNRIALRIRGGQNAVWRPECHYPGATTGRCWALRCS